MKPCFFMLLTSGLLAIASCKNDPTMIGQQDGGEDGDDGSVQEGGPDVTPPDAPACRDAPGTRPCLEQLCTSTGGSWEAICCPSRCGVLCPALCLDDACRCGATEIFDPVLGCIDSAECDGTPCTTQNQGSCLGTLTCVDNPGDECEGRTFDCPGRCLQRCGRLLCEAGETCCGSCDSPVCGPPGSDCATDITECFFPGSPGEEDVCAAPAGPIGPGPGGGCCSCGPDLFCNAPCMCNSPETPIATPHGDRPISSLVVGDLVYSMHGGMLTIVPIAQTIARRVYSHFVMDVQVSNGQHLRISAGHPTADGRTFGGLNAGDDLGGEFVMAVGAVAYDHDHTYDILPASDSGTYVAGGALIGSTLTRSECQP